MKIDQTLNLVSTVSREGDLPAYVYVTPFPYEIVEENHELLAQVFSRFYQNVGELGGVRVAAMMLRTAIKNSLPDDHSGPTLIDEIARFSSVVAWDGQKWKSYPLEQAIKNEIISVDEWRDVEGEVAFFIVGSAIQKKNLIAPMVGRILGAYGAQLTPLKVTAYVDSLPKSKTEETPEQTQDVVQDQTETRFIPS